MRQPIGRTVFPLVFMCFLFAAATAAEDRNDAKPLDTTAVLKFSIGEQKATVATATSRFAIVGTFSEEHHDSENHFSIKVVIDLGGTITQGKGGKPWLVEVHGTYSFEESHVETHESENGPVQQQTATHLKMALESSVYLRPGERTLIASQNDQKTWLTLQVPLSPERT